MTGHGHSTGFKGDPTLIRKSLRKILDKAWKEYEQGKLATGKVNSAFFCSCCKGERVDPKQNFANISVVFFQG